MELLFNIVYVRDTVDLLLPFLGTLLKHSPCHYRLVANGCTPAEVQMLQHFCQRHTRVSFYILSDELIIPHSDALNHLLQLDDSPYFAFMDSDIFAVGAWFNTHLEALKDHVAIFAGLPIWQELGASVWKVSNSTMSGRFTTTESDHPLGVTYYAIYQREWLRRCMEKYAVSFHKYDWRDIALPLRQILDQEALRTRNYDTGKVLNILLQIEGASLQYLPTPNLVHVGAASEPAQWAQQCKQQPMRAFLLALGLKVKLWRKSLKSKLLASLSGKSSVQREGATVVQTRRAANEILSHIKNQQSLPSNEPWLAILSPQMQNEFLAMGSQILESYTAFGAQMGNSCAYEENEEEGNQEEKKLGVSQ